LTVSAGYFVADKQHLSAVMGLMWVVGRVVYALGYQSGFPSRRLPGFLFAKIFYFGIHGVLIWWTIGALY
jgi:hypothetical protein